jgi:hypothetical protein
MLRTVRTFLMVGLAGVLSLVLAVPAHADQWDDYAKQNKLTADVKYKYSFDYQTRTWGPSSAFTTPQPVSGSIHPSNTGGSYYFNQLKNRALNPSNVPLTGKIIEPGKTLVRAPSTYGPVTKFATTVGGVLEPLGWGRILGSIGVGIGGTSLAPANYKTVAIAKGASSTCVNGGTCTAAETAIVFKVSNCAQFQAPNDCNSIGAQGSLGETDAQKWFRDQVLPLGDQLWAQLTGQSTNPTSTDQAIDVIPQGCFRTFGIEPRDGNNITLHPGGTILAPRPAGTTAGSYYDGACGPAALAQLNTGNTLFKITCIDAVGKTADSNGSPFGLSGAMNITDKFNADGTNRVGLCPNSVSGQVAPVKLLKVAVYNMETQTFYNATSGPSIYAATKNVEWTNPDTSLDSIEDQKITTSWQCRTPDGVLYTFTKSVTKIGAAVSPECAPGSDLVSHTITETPTANGSPATTLDSGAEIPAETAKYPTCMNGHGCSMDVYVDGTVCTQSRSECSAWPALSVTSPSRVTCLWGSYTVPLGNCNGLSNGYKPGSVGVVYDPNSQSWTSIDPYGRPLASNPEPWNPVNPNPVAGVDPAVPPAAAPAASGFPVTGVSPSNGCDAPAWSWNPVEFVHNPVVCALKDAFVPKTDITARMNTINTAAVTHPPMSWLFPPPMVAPGASGCPNWTITVAGQTKNVVCDSTFTAAILAARVPMFGLVATGMVFPLLRSIWYASIPILRVTPSSGK